MHDPTAHAEIQAIFIEGKELIEFPATCVMGSMAYYICNASEEYFQPMNANFGILKYVGPKVKKKEKKEAYANQALEVIREMRGLFS